MSLSVTNRTVNDVERKNGRDRAGGRAGDDTTENAKANPGTKGRDRKEELHKTSERI